MFHIHRNQIIVATSYTGKIRCQEMILLNEEIKKNSNEKSRAVLTEAPDTCDLVRL